MKILHVIPSIAAVRGGPSVAVIEIVKSLQLIDEVEVSIVTTNDNGDRLLEVPLDVWYEYEGVNVRFFPRFSPPIASIREFAFSASLTTWLWQHIKDYDLVHIHAIFSYCSTVAIWTNTTPYFGTVAISNFSPSKPCPNYYKKKALPISNSNLLGVYPICGKEC